MRSSVVISTRGVNTRNRLLFFLHTSQCVFSCHRATNKIVASLRSEEEKTGSIKPQNISDSSTEETYFPVDAKAAGVGLQTQSTKCGRSAGSRGGGNEGCEQL